jgi:hypothetical protein
LLPQTPFDLGHEVFRKSQVIEGLLQGLGGLLRLAAVSRETLLRCAATALAGFGGTFLIGFGPGHAVLLLRLGLRGTLEGWIMDLYAVVAQVVDLLDHIRHAPVSIL